jgi:hypothetical protein
VRALLFTACAVAAATIITPAPPTPFITRNDFVFSARHCCCCLCSSSFTTSESCVCVSWRCAPQKTALHARRAHGMRKRSSREIIFIPAWLLLRGKLLIFCREFSIAENESHCTSFLCNNCCFYLEQCEKPLAQIHSVLEQFLPTWV